MIDQLNSNITQHILETTQTTAGNSKQEQKKLSNETEYLIQKKTNNKR